MRIETQPTWEPAVAGNADGGVTGPGAAPARAAAAVAYRARVLVVDPDQTALAEVRARLERAGYEVVTRAQALGTAQAIADLRPDVIILEQQMPALSGERLARVLRSRQNDVPIIFHSRVDATDLQRIAAEVRALGVIPKTDDEVLFLAQFERLFAGLLRA